MRACCSIEGCSDPAWARGWCNKHYKRWRRYGDPVGGGPERPMPRGPSRASGSVLDRVLPFLLKSPTGCDVWTKSLSRGGYGQVQIPGVGVRRVHRIVYEELVGPIPEGLQLDHLCRNRACANPSHLEPVTQRENGRRGFGWSGRNARKTHCPQGHEYTPENTIIETGTPGRRCRICRAEQTRRAKVAYRARRKAS